MKQTYEKISTTHNTVREVIMDEMNIAGKSQPCMEGSNELAAKEKEHNQGGFTLIEIMAVMVAIGVLLYIIGNMIGGGGAKQNALLMERVANTAYTQFEMINMSCGTSMRISSNNVADSQDSEGVAELLFLGVLNEDYIRCVERSGVTPNSRDITIRGDGMFLVDTDFPIEFIDQDRSSGGARAFVVRYENVDSDTAEAVAQRYQEDLDLDNMAGNYPASAGDRAPLSISGSGDVLNVDFRFIW